MKITTYGLKPLIPESSGGMIGEMATLCYNIYKELLIAIKAYHLGIPGGNTRFI